MKSITNPMLNFAIKHLNADKKKARSNMTTHDQVDEIRRIFSKVKFGELNFSKYHIVIHSMDCGLMRSADDQALLSQLATVNGISLIVTVDHIKAGVMWSEQMLDRFNFMAVEMNTYEDFDLELEYQSALFSFKNDN